MTYRNFYVKGLHNTLCERGHGLKWFPHTLMIPR